MINRQPTVSPGTVGRVQDAIRLLDYQPIEGAISLGRADHKTSTIGLLLEDLANPFSSTLHRAVEDTAKRHGMLVLAGSSDEDGGRERETLGAFVRHRVDGLIVMPAGRHHHGLLVEQRRQGRPVVIVDRLIELLDADSVTADNRVAARKAVRHLAAHGHKRIAFLETRVRSGQRRSAMPGTAKVC